MYNSNHTLYYRDGPYKVTKNIMVQPGANLTIEQGVKMYFDPGIGIEVMGVLNVAVSKLSACTNIEKLNILVHSNLI